MDDVERIRSTIWGWGIFLVFMIGFTGLTIIAVVTDASFISGFLQTVLVLITGFALLLYCGHITGDAARGHPDSQEPGFDSDR